MSLKYCDKCKSYSLIDYYVKCDNLKVGEYCLKCVRKHIEEMAMYGWGSEIYLNEKPIRRLTEKEVCELKKGI